MHWKMIEKCGRSTKKDSLPEPLELAVLAFLFITPWGMTVGIALISPMLSLTSCGLRMQDPILKQKKNINAKSCQKNQINQDNQDNQVTHAKRSKQSRQPRQSSHPCTKDQKQQHQYVHNTKSIRTQTTQQQATSTKRYQYTTTTTTITTIVPGQTHSS